MFHHQNVKNAYQGVPRQRVSVANSGSVAEIINVLNKKYQYQLTRHTMWLVNRWWARMPTQRSVACDKRTYPFLIENI